MVADNETIYKVTVFQLTFKLYSWIPKGQAFKQRNNQQAPERSERDSVTKLRCGIGLAKVFGGWGPGQLVLHQCAYKKRRESNQAHSLPYCHKVENLRVKI